MNIDEFSYEDTNIFFQSIVANASLQLLETRCYLNHGLPHEENPLAVDYLCQKFGDQKSGQVDSILQVPICAECMAGLFSEYQILILCLNCVSSQWLFRPDTKLKYPEDKNLFLVTQCPECNDPSMETKVYAP